MSSPWLECPLDDTPPQPGWAPIWHYLQQNSNLRLEQDRVRVERRVIENAITFTTLDAGRSKQAGWRLDSVPYPIDQAEFTEVADGVSQRGRLLEAFLEDCYGPREAVRAGIIPADLLYGHPHFLRNVCNWRPRSGWLQTYACDVLRDPKGTFVVVSDRCQLPVGLGYALQNRLVLGGIQPAMFRRAGAQRLAQFVDDLRTSLQHLARETDDEPRMVLLSPGATAESAGEHAFLARFLGIDVVEGGDLTVRSDRVYLKTLGGLERVDVVLRRVADVWVDPLELRGDSLLGVPGLLGAARRGQVALANGIGAALAETAAISPFLPGLCRHYLGEELKLRIPEAWWLSPTALPKGKVDDILAADFVIRPAAADTLTDLVYTSELDKDEKSQWRDRLNTEGHRWVAVERIEPSRAPCWEDRQKRDRPVGLRFFGLKVGDDSWKVMPGALGRIAADPHGLHMSLRHGGGSKDVWVLGGEPSTPLPLTDQIGPQILRRGGVDVPSRLLDDVFWFGRSLERTEFLLRTFTVLQEALLYDEPSEHLAWLRLVARQIQGLPTESPQKTNGVAGDPKRQAASGDLHKDRHKNRHKRRLGQEVVGPVVSGGSASARPCSKSSMDGWKAPSPEAFGLR